MLEFLINPKRAEKNSWQMFFIGLLYSILSVIIANYLFGSSDPRYIGIWIITFTVILCIPFVYFLFRIEEKKDLEQNTFLRLTSHSKALAALMWLFLGFLIGYSICYMFLPKENFLPQIETFCSINQANNFEKCVQQYSLQTTKITGNISSNLNKFLGIFSNNMQVLIFTFLFSILFGAGGIFILAWNATVIASAIGIYVKSKLNLLPFGLARYMIHGIPEIGAYLIAALAGGILSVMITRKDYRKEKFWDVIQDVLILLIIGMIILVIAGAIEVFITPKLF